MQVKKHGSKQERQILTALIVNDQVLSRIGSRHEKDMFKSPWANLVADWCFRFHQKYNKAPSKAIRGIYERWATRGHVDESTSDIVAKFLGSLSDEYDASDEINPNFVVDQAGEYFNRVKLEKLFSSGADAIEAGDVSMAVNKVMEYRHVDLGVEATVDPYLEIDPHRQALTSNFVELVKYPGPVGELFRRQLGRECFVAFQAPMKRTKSFWVLDVAHRALMQRRRVLYFQVGDMSQDQLMRRMQARLVYRPIESGEYMYPTEFKLTKKGEDGKRYELKRERRVAEHSITLKDVQDAQKRFRDFYLRSEKSYFKLRCVPTICVTDIRNHILRVQDFDGWTPDVVAIDYIDLVTAPPGIREKRDQIKEVWNLTRRLALEQHCLIVSATQSKATAHKKEKQGRDDFSDNQLKMAEVTCMIGINATTTEMADEVARLSLIVVREGPYREGFEIHTASCLSLANPAVLSC